MRIVLASPTGICFGIKRAVAQLEEALQKNGEVYALGSPVHNPQEIERLKKNGLIVVDTLDDIPHGSVSFVRAHGIAPQALAELEKRSSLVIDGTCPFVKNAQERVKELSKDGYLVVISGDKAHPEVQGLIGFVENEKNDVIVVASGGSVPDRARGRRCGILSQTTQKVADFASLAAAIVPVSPELKIYNTICKATLARQESIRELASEVDGMIVLGGKNSANTRKLVEISESAGVQSIWLEHAGELDRGWLQNKEVIGVAAGGSTPDWLIKEMIEKLQRM